MNARWSRAVPIVMLLSLAACKGPEVTSRSPITEDDVGTADRRLAGPWEVFDERARGDVEQSPAGLVYLLPTTGPQLTAVWVLAVPTGFEERGNSIGAVVSGKVAGRWYVSVQRSGVPQGPSVIDFHIGRCDFDGDDTLHVLTLSKEKVRAAIESGTLRGREVKDSGLRITASTGELAAWVARQDPNTLFEPYMLLRRLRLPVPIVPEFEPGPGNPGEAPGRQASAAGR